MTVVGEAIVQVKPDATGFGSTLSRDVNGRLRDSRGKFVKAGEEMGGAVGDGASKGIQAHGGKITSSVGSIAKKAAIAFGAAFVVDKGLDLFRGAFAEGDEARRVAAQTAAVIKSTGDAANVSAPQIDALATSISNKTGIDDEAIASGANLLLTFTNVRNEAGKGNDIFNQATKTLADMGTALGTDASGSAIQLGKALNDPIKGIAALTRVGVTFTDEQKKQIENFQKSGDLAGAQKVILGELTKEFGGSAEAQASGLDKLKVAYGNLQETLGTALNPAIEQLAPILQGVVQSIAPVASELGGVVGQVLVAFAPLLKQLAPILKTVGGLLSSVVGTALAALVPVISSAVKFLTPLVAIIGKGLQSALKVIAPVLATVGAQFARVFDALGPILQDTFRQVLAQLGPQLPMIAQAMSEVAVSLGDLLIALLPVLVPILKLATLITTKIQAPILLLLAKSLSIVAAAVTTLVRPIASVLGAGLDILIGWITSFVDLFTKANLSRVAAEFTAGLAMIGRAIVGAVQAVGSGLQSIVGFFQALPGRIVGAIAALPGLLLTGITTALSFMANAAITGLTTLIAQFVAFPFHVLDAVLTLGPKLIGFLARLFPQVVAAELRGLGLMVSFFLALPGRVLGAVSSLVPRLVGFVAAGLGAVARAGARGVTTIVSEIGKLPGRILGLAGKILSAGTTIGGKIISGIKAGITGAAGALGDLATKLGEKLKEMLHNLVQKINDAIPDRLGGKVLGFDLPHNPIPNPFAFGGVTTEGRIDGTTSTRPEVVVPLSRGARRAADVARASGLLDLIGLGANSPLFGMEVPVSIQFVGVVPTQQEAAMVGRTVGDQIADRAVQRRQVLADARR